MALTFGTACTNRTEYNQARLTAGLMHFMALRIRRYQTPNPNGPTPKLMAGPGR